MADRGAILRQQEFLRQMNEAQRGIYISDSPQSPVSVIQYGKRKKTKKVKSTKKSYRKKRQTKKSKNIIRKRRR